MKVVVYGTVTEVTTSSYTKQDGTRVETFDAFIGEGRFYDRISGPAQLMPKDGDSVQYVALVQSKLSKAGRAYLNVWCVERAQAPAALKSA